MVKRFPHILKVAPTSATPASQDENGNWVIPEEEPETSELSCRVKPNVRSEYIEKGQDGERMVFAFTVYLPKGSPVIADGNEVEIWREDALFYKGKSLRFHSGQLHDRLWI